MAYHGYPVPKQPACTYDYPTKVPRGSLSTSCRKHRPYHEMRAPMCMKAPGCSVRALGCSVRAPGCSARAPGCSLRAQSCSGRAPSFERSSWAPQS
eukprot:scaffold50_cov420-Prasinococcus_capsulatus_cf.AAC.37